MDIAGEKIHSFLFVYDWILENQPSRHKDKYLEIHNSLIQVMISKE